MRDVKRVAFFGGIYSNYLALEQALRMAEEARVDAIWALGDFGAFGPHPDRTCELLREHGVFAIQGNYEESLSTNAEDCHCGYTDPRDNHFAQISYDYTFANTSREHKEWMGTLPKSARMTLGGHRLLLAHGSPRRINEFLWRSTTPVPFVEKMLRDSSADVVVCTHTGIHWSRMHAANRGVVNVGALGRPANDGRTNVWFAILDATHGDIEVEFLPVDYNHQRLA
jgi:predicted phosphodiesterase